MSEGTEGEGSLIPAWLFALRMRTRIPLRVLLESQEQQPAPEPARRKVSGKRREKSRGASVTR